MQGVRAGAAARRQSGKLLWHAATNFVKPPARNGRPVVNKLSTMAVRGIESGGAVDFPAGMPMLSRPP